MIEKLIAFLTWIQGSDSLKKWVDRVFSYLILFVVTVLLWKIGKEIFFECSYSYSGDSYYRGYSAGGYNCRIDLPWDGIFANTIGVFFLFGIVGSLIYGAYKKIFSYEYSVLRLLLNTTLPFMVGVLLLILWIEYSDSSYGPKWYIYFFGGLYALFPIPNYIKNNLSGMGILKIILYWYSRYIVSFLIGLAIFIVLFGLGNIFDEMRYMDFAEIVLALFLVFCAYGIGTWLILSYAWDEIKPIDEDGAQFMKKWGVGTAILFLCIWISPDWKEVIIDGRIEAAQEQLQEYGETAKGYEKAASVWGLKWAMKERYLENRFYNKDLYNKDLYAKIFDRSIESDIDDEIDVNKFRTRTSNGTSILARGENAKVELNFAKHESEIKSDIGAIETTVTYEFQNTDTQNQEVIYFIELPSSESVVTDLKLGLNLELPGLLAPRGAAEKVYNDSLRRNTDPALLEQTGPTTYRLRVFPVLSINDTKTQGRQRVQFRYITPIKNGENITVMPKTDIINLKLTKKSEIMTRVMEGTKALHQESSKTDDIEDLIAGKKVSVTLEGSLKESFSYCAINTYRGLDMKSFSGTEKNLTKNIVFLDISKSAGEQKATRKRYQELIDTWKNNGAALDVYTFNTSVTSAGYDLSDIEFWGNTDMAGVITYINDNGISNANIVILTDDESYEMVNPENKTLDYKKLKTNRISLIQIGDKIRTLKSEVTKSILASEGEVYRIDEKSSLDDAVKNIFTPKKASENCEPYNGTNSGNLSALEGGRDGKKVFGESIYGSGTIKMAISPVYLYGKNRYSIEKTSEYSSTKMMYDIKGNSVTLYYVSPLYDSRTSSGISIFEVLESGYYIFDGSSLKNVSRQASIYYDEEVYKELQDGILLEKIGTTARIVNQSMSLIALENDRQRADLERYSNQEDKYDTSYQNFDNTNIGGRPWEGRREMMFEGDVIAMPMSLNSVGSSSRADTMFGLSTKASSTSIELSSNTSIGGGMLKIGSSSGGKGGILQIIATIILFPLLAWFVLRKRKPKALPEEKPEEAKPE